MHLVTLHSPPPTLPSSYSVRHSVIPPCIAKPENNMVAGSTRNTHYTTILMAIIFYIYIFSSSSTHPASSLSTPLSRFHSVASFSFLLLLFATSLSCLPPNATAVHHATASQRMWSYRVFSLSVSVRASKCLCSRGSLRFREPPPDTKTFFPSQPRTGQRQVEMEMDECKSRWTRDGSITNEPNSSLERWATYEQTEWALMLWKDVITSLINNAQINAEERT